MPKPSNFGIMDIIAGIAITIGIGYGVAIYIGYGIHATIALSSLFTLMYIKAPARSFPTGEDITHGINLNGKVALVTGGTSGIGVDTCRILALRGAHVYIVARNMKKLEETKRDIETALRNESKNVVVGKISIIQCDLNDLQSVQYCAKTYLKTESKLDILINNAGIMAVPTRQATKQGNLEQQMGICHVGHFYLTELLLPALEKAATASSQTNSPSRIICLSSTAHRYHQMEECLKKK